MVKFKREGQGKQGKDICFKTDKTLIDFIQYKKSYTVYFHTL